MKRLPFFTPVRLILPVIVLAGVAAYPFSAEARPNILFLSIDDLNNDLGTLGVDYVKTPHLDAFAETGRLFSHHYVAVPSCGPSRAALLRGKRPTEQAHLPNTAMLRTHEDWGNQSLPAWFRKHGYTTLALGKVTHYPGGMAGEGWAAEPEELPGAWDRTWVPEGSPWATPEDMMHGYANGVPRDRGNSFESGSPAWEAFDGPDNAYPDGWVAEEAIEVLEELAGSEQSWFFAVGFFKPHLPFAAPKKYYEMNDPDLIPEPHDTDRHAAPSSWHPSNELSVNYGGHPDHPNDDPAYARQLRHAYAAATSYVDAQVGRVLEKVEQLGLDDNTIVVVWSDHGFALGHHGIWGKHSLYDIALKAPLMIRYPGIEQPGEIADAVIETVDLYPTLTDLAGVPTPEALHGVSLRPCLKDPKTPSVKPAFAFFRNGQTSVRNDDWRLIMHRDDEQILGYELFDFRDDPHGQRRDPDDHPSVVEDLSKHFDTLPWISR